MKLLLALTLIICSLAGMAQTHKLGLSGGVNTISSWDDEPPLGHGSPFDPKMGYSVNLTYDLRFKNNLTVNLRNGLTFLSFQSDDVFAFTNENNDPVIADRRLSHQYYNVSLGGGYLFLVGDRYSINAVIGGSMLYYFKQTAYYVGYSNSKTELDRSWEDKYRYYGVFLAMDHNYQIYSSRQYGLYLTGSLRATQVFNYLDYISPDMNRIIPEFTLGLAVAFGKQKGNRF